MRYNLEAIADADAPGKFGQTFVKSCLDGFDTLWYISLADPRKFLLENTGKIADISPTVFHKHEIETFLPEAGWRQWGNKCILVMKRPARQWKRSMCGATHFSYMPETSLDVIQAGGPAMNNRDVGVWGAIFKEPYVPIDEAVEKLRTSPETYTAFALNDMFAVNNKGLLFCLDQRIGKVNLKSKMFKVDSLFLDEARELFRDTSLKEIEK